jgi:hypothetical protein
MLLTGMFWTRQEQPFRMAWWLGCNGIAQIAGAGIAWGLGNKSGPVASWKLIFVVCTSFLPTVLFPGLNLTSYKDHRRNEFRIRPHLPVHPSLNTK